MTPLFLRGTAGPILALYHPPAQAPDRGLSLVYIPPFAEEMNRARRMAAITAKALAASGTGVLLLDPFGTGDSGGAFAEGRCAIWLEDIGVAAEWLARERGSAVGLWGLRLGALLAVAAASRQRGRFSRLLLWHPTADGKAMLSQFLRIRVAAGMADGVSRETAASLRKELASGRAVEVAGYEVSPALASELEALRIADFVLPSDLRADWIDLGTAVSEEALPAGQGIVEAWRHAGMQVSARTIAGPPFWSLQEVTLAPDLVAATAQVLHS